MLNNLILIINMDKSNIVFRVLVKDNKKSKTANVFKVNNVLSS